MTISVESPSRPPTHYRLPSGDMMPAIGLGCWQSPPEQLIPAVEHAIKVGYRHIDGATIYGNEDALGEGIRRSGVKREEIWVTTKLWNRQHRPKDVLPACKASLAALGLDYVDLWLMHYPCANDPDSEEYSVIDVPYTATWKAMEECVDLGLVRNIGVSNFSKIELETLLASCRIRPAVHQLERHVYLPQNEFVAWHKEIGLHITSYTPLANTKPSYEDVADLPPIQENATIKRIAKRYGLTPSNILISLQLSEGHSVLPKSVTPGRITENRVVVQLSDDELAEIADSCKGLRHRYCDFGEAVGYKYYVGLNDKD